MSSSVAAPAQHKQPSRKGKKAWRKHVDVTEVQEGLEEVRDQIIQGGVVSEKSSSDLFAVDTTGSTDIQKAYNRRHKPLKADEILAQRSAVPAVSSRKRSSSNLADGIVPEKSKKPRITYKKFDKLRSIAYGGDQVQKDIVQTGDAATHDPWAIVEETPDSKFSFLEKEKPIREPETLKHAPVSLSANGRKLPAVRKPEPGKSYNPSAKDYFELLQREGGKEVEAERKRLLEAQVEEDRLQRQLAAEAEEEKESRGESEWESEWEGFQSEVEGEEVKKKRPERKTPSQRNKINRRKEAERQQKHEAKMKARDEQAKRIQELVKSVEEKEKTQEAIQALALQEISDSSDNGEEVLRKKRFGKVDIPDAPLEVVLSDELKDSLRALKPEGNLLKDRFRSVLVRGKVESRNQIPYRKQAKRKATERWSYKDWKLSDHSRR